MIFMQGQKVFLPKMDVTAKYISPISGPGLLTYNKEMEDLSGRVMTIAKVIPRHFCDSYELVEDYGRWVWTSEFLTPCQPKNNLEAKQFLNLDTEA